MLEQIKQNYQEEISYEIEMYQKGGSELNITSWNNSWNIQIIKIHKSFVALAEIK